MSTDPAMPSRSSPCCRLLVQPSGIGDAHGNGIFLVSFPLPTCSQCNTTHKLSSYQRDGADPALFAAPFPYHISGLSSCLAVLLSAWLPAWLSLSIGVMHNVLTCLAFTHNMVKLYSQPHLSGSNQNQENKGREGTVQKEKHLYF